MKTSAIERIFKITVLKRIGNDRWRELESLLCDGEKKLSALVRKYKKVTNRRNDIGIRVTKFTVEEFINGTWQQLEEYPAVELSDAKKDKLETKRKANKEKWAQIIKAAEEEHKKRKERKIP